MSSSPKSNILLLFVLLSAGCNGPGPGVRKADIGANAPAVDIQPQPLEVQGDLRLEPGETYRPVNEGQAALVLEGLQDLVLDLRGVRLRGTPVGSPADHGQGWGVLIRGCERVKLLGGSVGGYKIGVRIENCDGVVIEGTEFAPVFGQRLDHASFSAGLQLDLDSPEGMLKLGGAAIAVIESSQVEIRGVTARGGQNGLILVRSEHCLLEDNDLSYLSGLGIALQASDHNRVLRNRCDGVTRRFEGGRTEADHGASGFLLCAGSSHNLLAGNLARGGTAGIRERAVHSLGCEDNRLLGNDLSYSSQVGLESFGSRGDWLLDNLFVGGEGCAIRIVDSNEMVVCRNTIAEWLGIGLQITGGQRSFVRQNRFTDCDSALKFEGGGENLALWVGQNEFRENIQDLVFEEARGLEFWRNDFEGGGGRVHLDGLSAQDQPELGGAEVWVWLTDAEGHLPSGRSCRSQLRQADPDLPQRLRLVEVWRNSRAGQFSRPEAPVLGGAPEMGEFGPLDPDPARRPGSPPGSLNRLASVEWEGAWFSWNVSSDPRGAIERWRACRFEPLVRSEKIDWKNAWGGNEGVRRALPETRFGLIARGNLSLQQAGEYLLSAIADDGVRVMIDGVVVLEDWAWHAERRRSEKIELQAGSHLVEVEYFQVDGTAVLSLDLYGPEQP